MNLTGSVPIQKFCGHVKCRNTVLVFDAIFDTVFDILTFHTLWEWFTNAYQVVQKSFKNINKM